MTYGGRIRDAFDQQSADRVSRGSVQRGAADEHADGFAARVGLAVPVQCPDHVRPLAMDWPGEDR